MTFVRIASIQLWRDGLLEALPEAMAEVCGQSVPVVHPLGTRRDEPGSLFGAYGHTLTPFFWLC
jgi:hypothetical protein